MSVLNRKVHCDRFTAAGFLFLYQFYHSIDTHISVVKSPCIAKSTLIFLKALSANNDRDWFEVHRSEYESAKKNVEDFVDGLIDRMNIHDRIDTPSGKKSLYRIYNDVRFSKEKIPYNPRFAGYLRRVKPFLRGGYYFWITPGNSRIGCGFSYPNPDDLKRIRQDIDLHYKDWNRLLRSRRIVTHFHPISGERVKTSPKGYAKDHPAIELLQLKQYWFERTFSDREVLAKDFLNQVNASFKAIRPFFDYMSEVLNTDANGVDLILHTGIRA